MAIGMVIFLSICVIVLSFWIRRSYLYFSRSIFGSIERLPFPVQEGVREGWEIDQGKEHITVVRDILLLQGTHYCCEEHITVVNFKRKLPSLP